MIEVTKETTRLEGTKVQLMSEFCCLVHHLVVSDDDTKKPIFTQEDLDYCIALATMPNEELHKLTLDSLQDMIENLL